MLGVASREHPPRMVGWKCGVGSGGQVLTPFRVTLVLNGEQGNNSADEARQIVFIELHEDPVGSPLQSVTELVSCGGHEPRHHARVRGVSRDIHVDLTMPMSELTVQAAAVGGAPLCSQSGATRPGVRCETRDGAARHSGATHQLQGQRRGSCSSVETKGEMSHISSIEQRQQ
jgi:hypothetical protein